MYKLTWRMENAESYCITVVKMLNVEMWHTSAFVCCCPHVL